MDLDRFDSYTRWHEAVNERTYRAPADPWRLLPVDPTAVTRSTNELRLDLGLGRVQGGDWDREEHLEPLRESTTYRGLVQRFEAGRDWEETALYRRAEARFERGETFRGYESLEAFRTVRCEFLDDLFRSIERDGYRPNEAAGHEPATRDNPFEDAYANHLEPLVAIGRSGEVYWCEGYHRLIIASILDLDEIPVYVLCRHEQWQGVRDRIDAVGLSELPSDVDVDRGHPDLQDVRAER